MTAVERVQAAIDKLTAQRDAATPGPWRVTMNNRRYGTHAIYGELPGQEVVGATPNYGGLWNLTDGTLIVTLHRTIDAQLAILNEARLQMLSRERLGLPLNTGPVRALFLADAILGDAS